MVRSRGAGTTGRKHRRQDIVQIVDQTQAEGLAGQKGTFNAQGFGVLEPYDSNTRSLSFDTSKTFHFLGQHTVSAGYTWQFPAYDDITNYSGGKFTLPSANATRRRSRVSGQDESDGGGRVVRRGPVPRAAGEDRLERK